jgi:hypothetical protein
MVALATGVLVLGMAVGATAAGVRRNIEVEYGGINLKVDGKAVDTGSSQPFVVVEEGRTYVPARYLAEALNAKVDWDAATKSVLVSTPRYYKTETQGDMTTYTFPYYGVSVKWPAGGKTQASDELLEVQYANNLTSVTVMNYQAAGFDTMVDAGLAAIKQSGATITAEEPVTVPGAVAARDATGTMKLAGNELPMRIRFAAADAKHLWMVMVIYNKQTDPDGAKAKSFLSGFTFGN